MVLDAQQVADMKRVLILSDGRAGHVNQSIALAKYLNLPYDVVEVIPKYRWSKAVSYLLDKASIRTASLFRPLQLPSRAYGLVVATGSLTYYMAKVLSRQLNAKSVAMMLPKGYRYDDYTVIFAQRHDQPPKASNIIEIPANFAYVEPKGLYKAYKKAIGIVIGGDNGVFTLSKEALKMQLDQIIALFSDYEIAVTTSPRTSKEIDALIASYGFDYEVIFSQKPLNPIPDFLEQCETVFITADSTSMISEAISFGGENVEILPLKSSKENKFVRFVNSLEQEGYLHIFDGTINTKNRKIDFKKYLKGLDL
jgi:mitochondrial fission protein ELM1